MFNLFKRHRPPRTSPTVPSGIRLYAVGDIHGRIDLLDGMLDLIEADARINAAEKTEIIFLGDLIDRGPASAEVVERLRQYVPDFATCRFILGNHEECMLDVLSGEAGAMAPWLRFGGDATLKSYGVTQQAIESRGTELQEQIRALVPRHHIMFLRAMVDMINIGNYCFVHAGVRPGVAINKQKVADLRWIREEFLNDERDHGAVIVHGHTISDAPELRDWRIGIDTGAYLTGALTALALEGETRWILST